MKKIILFSLTILTAAFGAYWVSHKEGESIKQAYQRAIPALKEKRVEHVKISKKQLESQPKWMAKTEVKNIINENKIQKSLQDKIDCIEDKSCLNLSERFYDPKGDPALGEIKSQLELFEMKLARDPSSLEKIDEDSLRRVLRLKHPGSFFIASSLLFRKNPSSIEELSELDYKGEEVRLFTELFKNRKLSDKERAQRNEKIMQFIEQDNHSFLLTLKELQHLTFEGDEAEMVKARACTRLEQIENFSGMYEKQISNFALRNGIELDC